MVRRAKNIKLFEFDLEVFFFTLSLNSVTLRLLAHLVKGTKGRRQCDSLRLQAPKSKPRGGV